VQSLVHAFPKILEKPYRSYMEKHSLRREIIATVLSNQIVNEMGITFVYRAHTETGSSVAEIIKAHTISYKIFYAGSLEELIDSLGAKVAISLQYELLHYVRTLLNLSTRWFLRSRYMKDEIGKTIEHFSVRIKKLEKLIPDLMSGATKEYLATLIERCLQHGFSEDVARRIAVYRALYTSLNIIEVETVHKFDLVKTAQVYFDIGSQFHLVWFRDQIAADTREGHWNTLARLKLRDELDELQKMLTVAVMRSNKHQANAQSLIANWMKERCRPIERWEEMLQLLHGSTSIDYTMFFIALRELSAWIQASEC
jgi:glutamate dehydrogenase